ncbi:MAG TPA: Hsp20/alpha crystallin family protein [Candidatus Binatia bacterium]|nr:Hsp20/alpha crystallin family protein [Candidatus Binatia bacterium]
MAAGDWDLVIWQRANDLLRQVERIHRNFLQIAVGTHYRSAHARGPHWEPPVNIIESEESLWVVSALPGVAADRVKVRLENGELVIAGERPLPKCCKDGELKVWEIPLGRFERRLSLVAGRGSLSIGELSLQDGLLVIELRKNS